MGHPHVPRHSLVGDGDKDWRFFSGEKPVSAQGIQVHDAPTLTLIRLPVVSTVRVLEYRDFHLTKSAMPRPAHNAQSTFFSGPGTAGESLKRLTRILSSTSTKTSTLRLSE